MKINCAFDALSSREFKFPSLQFTIGSTPFGVISHAECGITIFVAVDEKGLIKKSHDSRGNQAFQVQWRLAFELIFPATQKGSMLVDTIGPNDRECRLRRCLPQRQKMLRIRIVLADGLTGPDLAETL